MERCAVRFRKEAFFLYLGQSNCCDLLSHLIFIHVLLYIGFISRNNDGVRGSIPREGIPLNHNFFGLVLEEKIKKFRLQ